MCPYLLSFCLGLSISLSVGMFVCIHVRLSCSFLSVCLCLSLSFSECLFLWFPSSPNDLPSTNHFLSHWRHLPRLRSIYWQPIVQAIPFNPTICFRSALNSGRCRLPIQLTRVSGSLPISWTFRPLPSSKVNFGRSPKQ